MMKSRFSRLVVLCMVFVLSMPFFALSAAATDYTHGVDVSGTTATVWFKPSSGMSWVDIHYNINSGAQQNVRTTYNAAQARYEQSMTAAAGNVINYSFTYFNGSAADSPWYNYTVTSQASVATPTFSPDPGTTYTSAVTVTISTTTSGADIYYTTDGSEPTTSAAKYTSSFAISQSTTVKAIGVKAGMTSSAVASAAYTICSSNCSPPSDPTLDHGVDVSGTTATVWYKPSSGMSWVDIHYNINSGAQQNVRTTYNAAQARYEQVTTVAAGNVINYSFTYFNGSAADSPWYNYTVASQASVATPTFSPDPGTTYTSAVTVTISTTTSGADIYYTTDGSAPTTSATKYTGSFAISQSTMVKAIGVKAGMTSSAAASAAYTITSNSKVAAPTFSPDPGTTYTSAVTVTISTATGGADVYYTTDGSTPTTSATKYTGSFAISQSATIKAIGVKAGMTSSDVASAAYTISLSDPTLDHGVDVSGVTATVWYKPSSGMSWVDIHYNVNSGAQQNVRTTYNAAQARYEQSMTVAAGNVINYSFTHFNGSAADTPWYSYTVASQASAAPPSFSPDPGTVYNSAVTVTISTTTSGADIYYTTDGSAPTTSSTKYTGSFVISQSTTVKAIAVKAGMDSSAVASAAYTITSNNKAATPTFSPDPSAAYSSPLTVTISTATSGADIYYTTDGSVPTTSSAKYTAPFSVTCAASTIKAIAVKAGLGNSDPASAAYTLNNCGDYTQGVDENGTTGTIWFSSNVGSAWADIHYKVNSGAMLNGSMTYNSSKNRYEQTVAGLVANDVITYSFTYNKSVGGVDTSTFTYTVKGNVKNPMINPAGGSFSSPQQVKITTATSDAIIYYTDDGSTPTANSKKYTGPFVVSSSKTIKAIATKVGMYNSSVSSESYNFIDNKVETPLFSLPGGTFATAQTVSISTGTAGATIYYTMDGSTPTEQSFRYTGPFTVAASVNVKAIAVKSGMTSSNLASAAFIIGSNWNGMIIQLQNGSNGVYPDSQVYWLIIGYDPTSHQLCYVDTNGTCKQASLGDNTIDIKGRKAANIYHTMAEKNWIKMPDIESGRMYISYGTPVYITINMNDLGAMGFAGPDLNNPTDPNQDVYFEFSEFTILHGEYWGNTTRVDGFGFPITMRLTGENGFDKYPGDIDNYDKTVGDVGTRAEIFSAFESEVPAEFKTLIQAPYRIVAPGKGGFDTMYGLNGPYEGPYTHYFDQYIDQVWDYYRTHEFSYNHPYFGQLTGKVQGDVFVFNNNGEIANVYKPTTPEVLEGKGNFDKGTVLEKGIEALLCAAINRHVALNPVEQWGDPQYYYQTGPANYYAKFWHDHGIGGYAYGFCYDDVFEWSSLLHYTKPQTLTITVGW